MHLHSFVNILLTINKFTTTSHMSHWDDRTADLMVKPEINELYHRFTKSHAVYLASAL